MIPKKYKRGQLITIDSHVYRVTKGWCPVECDLRCVKCSNIFPKCGVKIGLNNCLKLVK